jgi:outer membrane protein assembly factor BamB
MNEFRPNPENDRRTFIRGFATSALVGLSLAVSGCSSLQTVFKGTEKVTERSASSRDRSLAIETKWVRSTADSSFIGARRLNRMTPVLTNELVIQGNGIDGVVAFSRANGALRWRFDVQGGAEGGALLDAKTGRVFLGAGDGRFYALSADTGQVIWSTVLRAESLAAPTLNDGVVYALAANDMLYALSADDGRLLWVYNRQTASNFSVRANSTPVVSGDRVIVGLSDGTVVAVKRTDGAPLWERRIARATRFMDVDSTPVVLGGDVFVSSFDGALHSIRASDGEINWVLEEGGYLPVVPVGGALLYPTLGTLSTAPRILLVDQKTGQIQRSIEGIDGLSGVPSLFGERYFLFSQSQGPLVLFDREQWRKVDAFATGLGGLSRPAVIDDLREVYFVSNDANLFSLRLVDSDRRRRWPL